MGAKNPVKTARLAKLLGMGDLAKLAGVSYYTVRRAERGLPITELSEARLAAALAREVDELFPKEEATTA